MAPNSEGGGGGGDDWCTEPDDGSLDGAGVERDGSERLDVEGAGVGAVGAPPISSDARGYAGCDLTHCSRLVNGVNSKIAQAAGSCWRADARKDLSRTQ